jgi:conjugal transfer pilus assembly protein TraK
MKRVIFILVILSLPLAALASGGGGSSTVKAVSDAVGSLSGSVNNLKLPAPGRPAPEIGAGVPEQKIQPQKPETLPAELVDPTLGLSVPSSVPAETEEDGQTVLPEVNTRAILSATELNRIYCPAGAIPVIPASREKGVKVTYIGKNAFLKLAYERVDGKLLLPKRPVELFIPCGDTIYQITGWPRDVPSQVIRLGNGRVQKLRDNIELYKGMPFERKVMSLIKAAYTDELPGSFEVRREKEVLRVFRDLESSFTRSISAVGTGLSLREYRVKLITDGVNFIELKERDFLRREFGRRIVAVAVDRLNLRKGETSRVFVVEMEGGGDESAIK